MTRIPALPPPAAASSAVPPSAPKERAKVYDILKEKDTLNPYERALNATMRRPSVVLPPFMPAADLLGDAKNLGEPTRAPATFNDSAQKVSGVNEDAVRVPTAGKVGDVVDGGDPATALSRRAAELWRQRLPRHYAVTRQLPFAEALERCDEVLCGQSDIKGRLALSFAAEALQKWRFFYFLQGPAGVGKTTLVSTLGKIYGRPIVVIRCDRVSSVEDLFGFHHNWKSPGPGRLTRAFAEIGYRNPVIFFDEIDKISGENKDAVLAALNELLSRETLKYRDNFLERDVDLSEVSFLCAGNSEDVFALLPWLKSRMGQILPFSGYNVDELRHIFTHYLLADVNQRTWQGGASETMRREFRFTDEARDWVIDRYCATMGANCGVRELKDWLMDIFTGYLQLGELGKPVERAWLHKHWNMLMPGHRLPKQTVASSTE